MVIIMYLSTVFPSTFPLIEVLLCIYVILFGGLAYYFPKVYILPAWTLNLLSFFLGMLKIATFVLFYNNTDKFYYFASGESRYHSFLPLDVYLTVLELVFLIILYRPALFHVRFLWGKLKKFYS